MKIGCFRLEHVPLEDSCFSNFLTQQHGPDTLPGSTTGAYFIALAKDLFLVRSRIETHKTLTLGQDMPKKQPYHANDALPTAKHKPTCHETWLPALTVLLSFPIV